jgi:alpha-mannosidase
MHRNGTRLARFVQTTQARRGSRILDIDIELDLDQEPGDDPWGAYYAVRWAWAEEAADLERSVGLSARTTQATFLEAPAFVDLHAARTRFTILPGGLPYHRKYGFRRMDTLLVVRGETARRFHLAVGVDLPNRAREAVEFAASGLDFAIPCSQPPRTSGWLMHLDAKNALATHWEPIADDDGKTSGFRVRILETEGRYARATLEAFRSIASARKTDFLGQPLDDLTVEGDKITLELSPNEWCEVEAKFCRSGGSDCVLVHRESELRAG